MGGWGAEDTVFLFLSLSFSGRRVGWIQLSGATEAVLHVDLGR